MSLGEFIRKYREEHGLSQRQLAKICGLSNGYISQLELGKNRKTGLPISPNLTRLHMLSKGMGIKVDDLLQFIAEDEVSISELRRGMPEDDEHATRTRAEINEIVSSLSSKKAQEALGFLRYLSEHEE